MKILWSALLHRATINRMNDYTNLVDGSVTFSYCEKETVCNIVFRLLWLANFTALCFRKCFLLSYISFLLVICGYNRLYQVNLAPFPTGKWCKVTHLYFRDIATFTVYVTALKSLSCSIRNLKLQPTCALRFTSKHIIVNSCCISPRYWN